MPKSISIKKVLCPECGREEILDQEVLSLAVRKAEQIGIYTLAFRHPGHILLVYVDSNGDIRESRVATYVEERASLFEIFDLLPIPKPRKDMPPLKKLPSKALAVLSLCDGQTTLKEIAEKLYFRYGEVKSIAEYLLSEGYLKDLVEVIA